MYLSAKDNDIKHFLLFMYFSRYGIIIADDCVLIIENLVVCELRIFSLIILICITMSYISLII